MKGGGATPSAEADQQDEGEDENHDGDGTPSGAGRTFQHGDKAHQPATKDENGTDDAAEDESDHVTGFFARAMMIEAACQQTGNEDNQRGKRQIERTFRQGRER